mgnify:CR=1 FL=1
MRIFGSDKVKSMVDALGLEEDEPIQAKMLTNAIENAQKNLESRNFDSRKHVLQYDEVMNEQRKIIYAQRQMVLDGEDISGTIKIMMESAIDSALDDYIGISEIPEDWNIRAITEFANQYLNAQGEFKIPEEDMETITKADVKDMLMELGNKRYESQEEVFGENMRELERVLSLELSILFGWIILTKWNTLNVKSVLEHTVSMTLFLNTEMSAVSFTKICLTA